MLQKTIIVINYLPPILVKYLVAYLKQRTCDVENGDGDVE